MALLAIARQPSFCEDDNFEVERPTSLSLVKESECSDKDLSDSEKDDVCGEMAESPAKSKPKLGRLRSPSFEGYFASRSGAVALQYGSLSSVAAPNKIVEIQAHLEQMISLLRDIDVLRMAVRIESKNPLKKRYLTVVSSEQDHSAIIGIDWFNDGPTIGLVYPIWNTTKVNLDGDGGFRVARGQDRYYIFKPVSVQTLWSALQVIQKAHECARKYNYYPGSSTSGFIEYYIDMISSDDASINEWEMLDDTASVASVQPSTERLIFDKDQENFEASLRHKLRELMMTVDLDEVNCRDIRQMCEKELGFSLKQYRKFIDKEVITIMGQLDSPSQIFDFLYLGSEYNASDLAMMKNLGVGFILNVTRECENFYPSTFTYYNVRVNDEEAAELLHHWDHCYRFIEKARESGKKILVHCRMGISRSGATVIAYAMKKKGWSLTEAMQFVVSRRGIVNPNPGFQKQLLIYEGILNSSRNRFSKLFHQKTIAKQMEEENKKTALKKRQHFKNTKGSQEAFSEENAEDETEVARGKISKVDEESENADPLKNQLKDIGVVETATGKLMPVARGETGRGTSDVEVASFDEDVFSAEVSSRKISFVAVEAPLVSADVVGDSEDGGFVRASVQTPCTYALQQTANQEADVEDMPEPRLARQQTFTSASSRGRLMRAKTMPSGAVLIDEEDGSETISTDDVSDITAESLEDPDEDAIMAQVRHASEVKEELLQSVRKLFDAGEPVEDSLDDNLIKPSVLRKLSHASAIMHLESIAAMKRQKALDAYKPVQESSELAADGSEVSAIHDTSTISKDTVSTLKEGFQRRSRMNIRDNARRWTLDEKQLKASDFDFRLFSSDTNISEKTQSETQSTQSMETECSPDDSLFSPDRPRKLEIAAKVEKVLPSAKPEYPRYRQYGTVGRSSSLKVRRKFQKQPTLESSQSSTDLLETSLEAVDFNVSEINAADAKRSTVASDGGDAVGICYSCESSASDDTFCVADLVHLHDKMIREKGLTKTKRAASPFFGKDREDDAECDDVQAAPEVGDLATLRVSESPCDEEVYKVLVHGKLKEVRQSRGSRLKRVQSFPGSLQRPSCLSLNSDYSRDCPEADERLQPIKSGSSSESHSLPTSPNQNRRQTWVDRAFGAQVIKSDRFVYLSMMESERPKCDVKSIVNSYEAKQGSGEGSRPVIPSAAQDAASRHDRNTTD